MGSPVNIDLGKYGKTGAALSADSGVAPAAGTQVFTAETQARVPAAPAAAAAFATPQPS